MTDWKPFPEETVHLPEGGKVTGKFEVVWQGNGRCFVRTDAHLNDDKPALNFRGESFLFSAHLVLSPGTGQSVSSSHSHATRRSNWTDAPPSFHKAIEAAVTEAVEGAWTHEKDRAGLEADVAQYLNRLEKDREDLLGQMAKVDAQITEQRKRLGVRV